jgi:predicted transcriptional regulator
MAMNSNKTRILNAAVSAPGIHLRELARSLGLSLHTVRFHVEALSKSGLIICEKQTGYSRIFPAGTDANDIITYSFLRNNSAKVILVALSSGSLFTNKEICERTGLAKSTVSELLQKFLESHLVVQELSDSGVKTRLENHTHLIQLLENAKSSISVNVVDNFIELWDF